MRWNVWVVALAAGCGSGAGGSMVAGSGFVEIATGAGSDVCGLKLDGTIACAGTTTAPPAESDFTHVEIGFGFGCASHADGTIACWGFGSLELPGTFTAFDADGGFGGGPRTVCGLAADGSVSCAATFVAPSLPAGPFAAVATGGPHVCAIQSGTGSVVCGGDATLQPPGDAFDALSVGYNVALGAEAHACGILVDGSLRCFGKDEFGESTPPSGRYTQVSVGRDHSCAIGDDGLPACWGRDDAGESSPPAIALVQISAAIEGFTCGVTAAHDAVCWGNVPALP